MPIEGWIWGGEGVASIKNKAPMHATLCAACSFGSSCCCCAGIAIHTGCDPHSCSHCKTWWSSRWVCTFHNCSDIAGYYSVYRTVSIAPASWAAGDWCACRRHLRCDAARAHWNSHRWSAVPANAAAVRGAWGVAVAVTVASLLTSLLLLARNRNAYPLLAVVVGVEPRLRLQRLLHSC